ncbi:MAG TPA: hypothetical protein VHW64_02215 [Nocardioides sp.]|uniref:hypothetical protein n=1 Tax=Nocardioides sp. TaxID=35761 RepID=UPI002E364F26|nr:hypothetical protein [Nocardioides sp.]HEX3929491.1 hypothetical protein [Nocardioides sp.]
MSTSFLGPAILALLGLLLVVGVVGIAWGVIAGLVSLLRDALLDLSRGRAHLPRRGPIDALPKAANGEEALPTELPDRSTETMWHQMQGRSTGPRGRRWIGTRSGPKVGS